MIKGQQEYERFKSGKSLTFKQAILGFCYICNGMDEGGMDCRGKSCLLYPFMPYGKAKRAKRAVTPEKRAKLAEALGRARMIKGNGKRNRAKNTRLDT